ADDGQGIDADFLPHVFDRFRQADSSLARTHGGLGLGMAIVRHLVELHGGTISVASAGKGQGATFVVTLPVRPPPADAVPQVEQRAAPRDAASESDVSLDGISVLIVDDEADAREVLSLLLQERGAEVNAVSSAAAALRVLKKRV